MTIADMIATLPDDTGLSVTIGGGVLTKAELADALGGRHPDSEPPEELRGVRGLRQLAPSQPCVVYFLVREGVVVYVGQTKSAWPRRVWQHVREGVKDFDDVWYVECDSEAAMTEMEAHYIRMLLPEHNRIGTKEGFSS